MYWNSAKLKKRIRDESLISGFEEKRVKHCAYELALGTAHLVTAKGKPKEYKLGQHGSLAIPPGQFALLMTEEIVAIPLDAIGFISIRARWKFKGLINVSGFHVDPGYKNRLKFSVYNAGGRSIHLTRGDEMFMIWYADLSGVIDKADGYGGEREGNNYITSEDRNRMEGEVSSPGQLKNELSKIRSELKITQLAAATIISLAASFLLKQGCAHDTPNSANVPMIVNQNLANSTSNTFFGNQFTNLSTQMSQNSNVIPSSLITSPAGKPQPATKAAP